MLVPENRMDDIRRHTAVGHRVGAWTSMQKKRTDATLIGASKINLDRSKAILEGSKDLP